MAIPYSPILGDTIPGFIAGDVIRVPFVMNPAVSWGDTNLKKFSLKIMPYENATEENTITTAMDKPETETNELEFDISNLTLDFGQYYKFQLAYSDDNTSNLKYSAVAIGKCIGNTVPTAKILDKGESGQEEGSEEELGSSTSNMGIYIGKVEGLSESEPIYSYRFDVSETTTDFSDLSQTTGEVLYKEDEVMKFQLQHNPEGENEILLRFSFTTINGYVGTSETYIIKSEPESPLATESIEILQQEEDAIENGYIKIKTKTLTGKYILERTEDGVNYDELISFDSADNTSLIWEDHSVEQGIGYYYTIRKVNEYGQYLSSRKQADAIARADFEDIFLTDINGKQLKIKFNPKVSSFKDTILEQKTDTIGSRYPFFFRNGAVKYKEIPISGLISYHMDEEFMSDEELGFLYYNNYRQSTENDGGDYIGRSTQLTSENFAAERKFKLKVLDWLNDGAPKLFRSPAEGNYVVRLMNVSLSPTDTLGRMIHSFSATGYEVSENDLKTLKTKGYANYPQKTEDEYNNEQEYKALSKLGYFVTLSSSTGTDIPDTNKMTPPGYWDDFGG